MTTDNTPEENTTDPSIIDSDTANIPQPSKEERLAKLKIKAKELGLSHSHQIGPDALSKKINDFLDGDQTQDEETMAQIDEQVIVQRSQKKPYVATKRTDPRILKIRAAQKLLLVKVVCMNPQKKEWEGEILTVGNSVVGTYRKYVKFNSDRGWYIPQIMYNVMSSRKCQLFKTVKVNGRKIRQGYLVDEFAMTILPNQTRAELDKEAFRQAAAAATE